MNILKEIEAIRERMRKSDEQHKAFMKQLHAMDDARVQYSLKSREAFDKEMKKNGTFVI